MYRNILKYAFKYTEAASIVWRMERQEQDYQQQEIPPPGRSHPLHQAGARLSTAGDTTPFTTSPVKLHGNTSCLLRVLRSSFWTVTFLSSSSLSSSDESSLVKLITCEGWKNRIMAEYLVSDEAAKILQNDKPFRKAGISSKWQSCLATFHVVDTALCISYVLDYINSYCKNCIATSCNTEIRRNGYILVSYKPITRFNSPDTNLSSISLPI